MPAQGSPPTRESVEREVAEIERLCGVLERALVDGDWNEAGNAMRASRRSIHAFLNAMETLPDRDDAFDETIHERMRRVYDIREDQLARLIAFRDGVGQRLQTLSRWKAFASSMGTKRAPKRTAGIDQNT